MDTIRWRGFELAFKDEGSWSCHYAVSDGSGGGYIGVSHDAEEIDVEKRWSALVEYGELSGDGWGSTPHIALDAARYALIESAVAHVALIEHVFSRPPVGFKASRPPSTVTYQGPPQTFAVTRGKQTDLLDCQPGTEIPITTPPEGTRK